ncbi:MAG: T9SS type A sorting domain-containing protein [Muribaculaceae bacterium]|nr:T9SS type A sorting domain-containing protein [Muribaculaceae bacterium]
MKKFLLSAIIATTVLPAMADLEGNGYYRVQNAITKRYAYLLDNKGSFNAATGSIDVQALELFLGFSKACSDPATVFYIDKTNSTSSKIEYDVAGQGTSLHGFLNHYLYVLPGKKIDGVQAYYAYGQDGTMIKYLGDRNPSLTEDKGLASVDVSGDRRLWYIDPVVADSSDGYFGVAPSIECGGKYYYPMYAGFPYAAYSEGIKFYTVTKVNPWAEDPAVCLHEVTGVIPEGTPVIIECTHQLPADNRLNVGAEGSKADVGGNLLKGVYFNNDDVIHGNRKAYDRKTMRILTVKDGKLCFDVADIDYLPRNQAYLQLSETQQYGVECFKVVSEEEYEAQYDAVDELETLSTVDVYSLDGSLLISGAVKEEISSLGKGLYIVRSGTSSRKMVVR